MTAVREILALINKGIVKFVRKEKENPLYVFIEDEDFKFLKDSVKRNGEDAFEYNAKIDSCGEIYLWGLIIHAKSYLDEFKELNRCVSIFKDDSGIIFLCTPEREGEKELKKLSELIETRLYRSSAATKIKKEDLEKINIFLNKFKHPSIKITPMLLSDYNYLNFKIRAEGIFKYKQVIDFYLKLIVDSLKVEFENNM